MRALVRAFVVTAKRIATQRQHLAFNYRCKRYQLMPRCLRVKPLVQSHEGEQIAERTSRQFLCAQIEHNHRVARRLELDLRFRRQVLTETLRRDELEVLVSLSTEVQINEQEKCKSRQKRKFDALLTNARQWRDGRQTVHGEAARRTTDSLPKWVVNLSSRPLSDAEQAVLSKDCRSLLNGQFSVFMGNVINCPDLQLIQMGNQFNRVPYWFSNPAVMMCWIREWKLAANLQQT